MSRIAYVNGRYLPHRQARVHIEDRGYQFADGIYEVIAIRGGNLVDELPHLDRLDRSLREMRIAPPMARAPLRSAMREVIIRNRVADGIIYMQITRGVAPRDHGFPKHAAPSIVMTAKRTASKAAALQHGVTVITTPDLRWKRRDIKTVGLTANVLAKQAASEAGAYEAWLVDTAGMVSEGTSSNAWIVTRDKELVTYPPNHDILNGITRLAIRDLATKQGYRVVERPFSLVETLNAAEAFVTGTTSWVIPVTRIDGKPIADGLPGPLTRALQQLYIAHADAA